MAFHLGKPILVMIVCAAFAGVTSTLTRRSDGRAGLEYWAFSDQNYKAVNGVGRPAGTDSLKTIAERNLHQTVNISLIQYRALSMRLSSLFMSDARGPDVPDVVDIEIGSVGQFFRPPVDQVGLLPLNDFIKRHGWEGKILESRLALWSKEGVIFGIPQDVHPTMIAYDEQAFREAGVDLAKSATWEQFIDNGLKFQAYWNKPGQRQRHAFEMGEASASTLLMMLLQRGINVVDDRGVIYFKEEKTIDTLVKYVRMLAGPRAVGVETGMSNEAFSQDLRVGYVSAFMCPDWRIKYMMQSTPAEFSGRMRLMPLPAWPDSPYRTSTWGGSMTGIPRNAADPEASWRLIEQLYLSPEALEMRRGLNYVLPAAKSAWRNAELDKPDPYFGGQPVRRMMADLAPDTPARYVSPASAVAEAEITLALLEALHFARSEPAPTDDALRVECRRLLTKADDRLRRLLEHGRFEP